MKVSRLLLASESARRVNLLNTAGYEFEARKSGFPEVVLEDPVETVRANAEGKALAITNDPDTVVLAADTIVYLPDLPIHDRILGQARNEEDVRRFIRPIARTCARSLHRSRRRKGRGSQPAPRRSPVFACEPSVAAEVESYVRYGEGIGKAGGYAVQGRAASFVEWIGGDYTTVVGLPLALTGRMLAKAGIPHPERAVRKTSSLKNSPCA